MTFEHLLRELRTAAGRPPLAPDRRLLIHLGAAVNAARTAKDLSQRTVARRAGVTQRQVSLLENGNPVTTVTLAKVLVALERRFKVQPDLLVTAGADTSPTSEDYLAFIPGGLHAIPVEVTPGGDAKTA